MGIQRVEQFMTGLAKCQDETSIKQLCDTELAFLRKEYNVQSTPLDNGVYPGLTTYKKAITDYRSIIAGIYGQNIAWHYFKMNETDTKNMMRQNKDSGMRNYKRRKENGQIFIENLDGYINLSVSLLNASSYIDNILGLAALTGRRVNEIGYSCDFELSDYDEFYEEFRQFDGLMSFDIDHLHVYGLSKKQTYLNNKKTKSDGIIPVLYKAEIIYNAFQDLRKRKSFYSANDFHDKASKELSKKVKKHYGEHLGEKCTAHDLRKAYPRILYDCYFQPVDSNDAISTFFMSVLLENTPDNYQKFSGTR